MLLLLKLLLPISLAVGLLRWSGALAHIGAFLAPAMGLFRLPGEAAVAMVSGLAGGIYALIAAMAVLPLNGTEITVLSAMSLVAHNLIVECTVQDRAGSPWWWTLSVRLLGSSVLGLAVAWSIHGIQDLGWPALWLGFRGSSTHASVPVSGSFGRFLLAWAREGAHLTVKVALIVTAMMIATEWIRARGILARVERRSRPLLRVFGLSDALAYLWLTAQLLGVTYGSGLLIEEMREKEHYRPLDVRELNTSIGLSHSMFEDTILLAAIGASLFWIIIPRCLLAAAAVRLLRPLRIGLRGRQPASGR